MRTAKITHVTVNRLEDDLARLSAMADAVYREGHPGAADCIYKAAELIHYGATMLRASLDRQEAERARPPV